jgi:hypothetical protein
MEFAIMWISIFNANDVVKWTGRLAAASLAMVLVGCGPEGAGTIEVNKPDAIQSKAAGGDAIVKPTTAKQAKAMQIEEEAAKKNPKLR